MGITGKLPKPTHNGVFRNLSVCTTMNSTARFFSEMSASEFYSYAGSLTHSRRAPGSAGWTTVPSTRRRWESDDVPQGRDGTQRRRRRCPGRADDRLPETTESGELEKKETA